MAVVRFVRRLIAVVRRGVFIARWSPTVRVVSNISGPWCDRLYENARVIPVRRPPGWTVVCANGRRFIYGAAEVRMIIVHEREDDPPSRGETIRYE